MSHTHVGEEPPHMRGTAPHSLHTTQQQCSKHSSSQVGIHGAMHNRTALIDWASLLEGLNHRLGFERAAKVIEERSEEVEEGGMAVQQASKQAGGVGTCVGEKQAHPCAVWDRAAMGGSSDAATDMYASSLTHAQASFEHARHPRASRRVLNRPVGIHMDAMGPDLGPDHALPVPAFLARYRTSTQQADISESLQRCLEAHQDAIRGDLGGGFPTTWAFLGIDQNGNLIYAIHCLGGDHGACQLFPDNGTRSAAHLNLSNLDTFEI
ncbi:hypothetical protein IW261DRAFT_1596741 [Armillaria novae-zelandiae]|uniref:Uncharacterized protein n=1 Tax=Armillaria novae-zelandiae TaxID=153914 RepID=A0AA39NVD3_9AGAR|nr:hypothetical protein IW261DRAFT_1596741 [Armillaria novae-zelandiae]